MRFKHKIQHYLTITDNELKFLLGLSGIFLVGVCVKYYQSHRVPDYSERYAVIDSLMSAAENNYTAGRFTNDVTAAEIVVSDNLPSKESGSYNAPLEIIETEAYASDPKASDKAIPNKDTSHKDASTIDTAEDDVSRESIASSRVNLNTASVAELQNLPGIGPAIAGRIVDYRTRYGRFQRTADLMNVKGIGPRTFEKLQSDITL